MGKVSVLLHRSCACMEFVCVALCQDFLASPSGDHEPEVVEDWEASFLTWHGWLVACVVS